jgi:hypothetical protein
MENGLLGSNMESNNLTNTFSIDGHPEPQKITRIPASDGRPVDLLLAEHRYLHDFAPTKTGRLLKFLQDYNLPWELDRAMVADNLSRLYLALPRGTVLGRDAQGMG